MKTVLVKEFGQATFDEVKQHVRDTMQQMEQHHLMPAADGADQLDTSNLFDRPPGSYVQNTKPINSLSVSALSVCLYVLVSRPDACLATGSGACLGSVVCLCSSP